MDQSKMYVYIYIYIYIYNLKNIYKYINIYINSKINVKKSNKYFLILFISTENTFYFNLQQHNHCNFE